MFHVIFRSALAAPSWMIHERMVVAPHAEGFLERNPMPRLFEGRREDVWGRGADDAIAPIVYSAVFSDHAVLQYGAKTAAVLYGQINERASAATKVTLRMTSAAGEESYSVPAVVDVRDGTWRAQLEPSAAYGGSYTASVSCTTCTNTTATVLRDLTYGDVFFCSGQSNMQLSVYHTFGRNWTKERVSTGDYDHIRLMLVPTRPLADAIAANASDPSRWILPYFASSAGAQYGGYGPHQWLHSNVELNDTDPTLLWEDIVDQFSATCWYTASRMSDRVNDLNKAANDTSAPVPMGLIESAVGGTTIQSWTPNNTLAAACKNASGGAAIPHGHTAPGDGSLFNGMVLPFVNMTIKGVFWYQGENNCQECNTTVTPGGGQTESACGNPLQKTGYACYFEQMVNEWRSWWSFGGAKGLTDALFPIGVVNLASFEGQCGGGWMAMAQSGGTGRLPTARLPNTFTAQGFDAAEPSDPSGWNHFERTCACSGFDSAYACMPPGPATNFFMGPIHPRSKQIIGDRLARAALHHVYGRDDVAWSGPILKGCALSTGATFHREHMTIALDITGKANTIDALSIWTKQISSPEIPYALAGSRCSAWPNASLNPLCSSFGPSEGSLEIEYTYNGTAVWLPVSFQLDKGWKNGTDAKTTAYIRTHTSKTNRPSIVDGNTTQNWPMHFATGVRYAFGQSCCSYFAREDAACPVNSCPLRLYNSTLPVVPFIAKFVDGRCKCTPPMVCDA